MPPFNRSQSEQRRSLAALPRRVQHEVALLENQREQLALIQPPHSRDAVVVVQGHRPGSIEETPPDSV